MGNFIAWSFNMLDRPSLGLAFHVGNAQYAISPPGQSPFSIVRSKAATIPMHPRESVGQNGNVLLNYE